MAIRTVEKPIKDLFDRIPFTFISTDASAAGTTIDVESIEDFAVDKILFFEEPGHELAEIVKTHATTTPSGTTVTLAAGLVFAHTQGVKVHVIDYDQIEFSHADTAEGTKSVLSTQDIQADQEINFYKEATETAGYFFTRYKETIGNTFSAYSDPIPYGGWTRSQVGFIIEQGLTKNKLDTYEGKVTKEFCFAAINRSLDNFSGKLKKFHTLQDFDYIVGQISEGEWRIAMPSDAWQYSNKSILAVRFGDSDSLDYRDEREWNELTQDVTVTNLASGSNVTVGDTDIAVDNSYDLDDSGTLRINGQNITYTAKTDATGAITGVPASGTGSITTNLTALSSVWQGSWVEGEPTKFTVKEGYLYVWPIPDSTYGGKNVYLDYWKGATDVDSLADTVDSTRKDAAIYWLAWEVRAMIKNDGILDRSDGDYAMYLEKLEDTITLELKTTGQKRKMKPRVNQIKFQ